MMWMPQAELPVERSEAVTGVGDGCACARSSRTRYPCTSAKLRLLAILLSAAPTAATANNGYDSGEDVPRCWRTPASAACQCSALPQPVACDGISIGFVQWSSSTSTSSATNSPPPPVPREEFILGETYDGSFRIEIPAMWRSTVRNSSVAHANLHICQQGLDQCSPFSADLCPRPSDTVNKCVGLCPLPPSPGDAAELLLDAELELTELGEQTVIAHAYWWQPDGARFDVARAITARASYKPLEAWQGFLIALGALALCGLGVAATFQLRYATLRWLNDPSRLAKKRADLARRMTEAAERSATKAARLAPKLFDASAVPLEQLQSELEQDRWHPERMPSVERALAGAAPSASATPSAEPHLAPLVLRTCAEVYETEVAFRRKLCIALTLFKGPMEAQLGPAVSKQVFANLEVIEQTSRALLREIAMPGDPVTVLCNAFLSLAPFLKSYIPYSANYDDSRATLQRLQQDVGGLQSWLQRQAATPLCNGLPIEAFLIMPIQRLMKFPLFFETLAKALPTHELVLRAAEAVRGVTSAVDSKASNLSRKGWAVLEGLGKVWLELLAPQIELVLESGATLRPSSVDGTEMAAATPRNVAVDVYLFSDFVLITRAGVSSPLLVAFTRWLTVTNEPAVAAAAATPAAAVVVSLALIDTDHRALSSFDEADAPASVESLLGEDLELEFMQPKDAARFVDALHSAAAEGGASAMPDMLSPSPRKREQRRTELLGALAAALREERRELFAGRGAADHSTQGRFKRQQISSVLQLLAQDGEVMKKARQPLMPLEMEVKWAHLLRPFYLTHHIPAEEVEAGAHNAMEVLSWDGEAGLIHLCMSFNAGGPNGKQRRIRRTAWTVNPLLGTEWRVQRVVSGVRLVPTPLLILSVASDYTYFMVGDPQRTFIRIYCVSSSLREDVLDTLKEDARTMGFDLRSLEAVSHHSRASLITGDRSASALGPMGRQPSTSRLFSTCSSFSSFSASGGAGGGGNETPRDLTRSISSRSSSHFEAASQIAKLADSSSSRPAARFMPALSESGPALSDTSGSFREPTTPPSIGPLPGVVAPPPAMAISAALHTDEVELQRLSEGAAGDAAPSAAPASSERRPSIFDNRRSSHADL